MGVGAPGIEARVSAALATLPAKTCCLPGLASTAASPARAPSAQRPSSKWQSSHLSSGITRNHPDPTGTLLTPCQGWDHLTRPGGAACCHQHPHCLLRPPWGSWSCAESVQPAGLWLGISLGAATFGTHYLIINFLLSSTPSTPL